MQSIFCFNPPRLSQMGAFVLHLASDDSDHRPFQICILMEIHDTHNQVSFHIYILQMQRSPTRAPNSRDGRRPMVEEGPNTVGCSLFRPSTLAPVGPPSLSKICKLAPYPPPTPHNNDPLQVWSGFFLMPRRCPILKTIQKSGGANAWGKKFLSLFLKVLQNS